VGRDDAKKISVITAVFNSQKYLSKAIASVIGQTYRDLEYIIVDGGSIDASLETIMSYGSRIARFISEPDGGIYEAFNKGLNLAQGEIVYYLNSDDYLYDERVIDDVMTIFNHDPELRFVYGNTLILDQDVNYHYDRGRQFFLKDLKTGDMPPHQGFFVKRGLIEKIGLFDIQYKIAADFDLIIRCFKEAAERSYYFNRTIAVFREGGVSTHPDKQRLMNWEQRRIIKKHFGCDQAPNLQLDEINGLYKVWLESLLLRKKGITHCLHDYQVKNVAIYGTRKTALHLYEDLKRETFHIVCFLDNNQNMQGQCLAGLPIYPPEWICSNQAGLDAVISSIEGRHDLGIIGELNRMIDNHKPRVCSWKDLVRGKPGW
jgi:glycosyltransferase involved in cell wall biosynthesis